MWIHLKLYDLCFYLCKKKIFYYEIVLLLQNSLLFLILVYHPDLAKCIQHFHHCTCTCVACVFVVLICRHRRHVHLPAQRFAPVHRAQWIRSFACGWCPIRASDASRFCASVLERSASGKDTRHIIKTTPATYRESQRERDKNIQREFNHNDDTVNVAVCGFCLRRLVENSK